MTGRHLRILAPCGIPCGPGGPRTTARRGAARYADVLVRIPAPCGIRCGSGGPRTAARRGASRYADVLVRIPVPCGIRCGPGGPRTAARRGGRAVRGRPRPHSSAVRDPVRAGRPAYRGTARGPRGTRTSSSAFRCRAGSPCGPGGPRTAPRRGGSRYADVLVRIPVPRGPGGLRAFRCRRRGGPLSRGGRRGSHRRGRVRSCGRPWGSRNRRRRVPIRARCGRPGGRSSWRRRRSRT